jgi:hypothetical protein
MVPRERLRDRLGLRELALAAAVLGTGLLALLPAALERFGTSWRPGVRMRPRDVIIGRAAGAPRRAVR